MVYFADAFHLNSDDIRIDPQGERLGITRLRESATTNKTTSFTQELFSKIRQPFTSARDRKQKHVPLND